MPLPDGTLLTGSDDRSWLKLAGGAGTLADRIAATPTGHVVRLNADRILATMQLLNFPSEVGRHHVPMTSSLTVTPRTSTRTV